MARIRDLVNYLSSCNVQFQVLNHVPAFSAHQMAAVAHVPDSKLAKTLLIKGDLQYWLAVLRADQRIDQHLLKDALEVKHVSLAHEENLEALFPDCEVGAMPPFGNLYGLPVIVDSSLAEDDEIVFNACTHTESIRIKFEDFERLAKPIIAPIAERAHELYHQ